MASSGIPDRAFWAGRRVLVTGHTGFVGGWLCAWLSSWGAHVTGFALAPHTEPHFFGDYGLAGDVDHIIGDIRDPGAIRQAAETARPEILLHLAAQPLVRAAFSDPVSTVAANVMGVAHVLETARQAPGLKAFINFTTDKVYDNHEWTWPYRETDRLGGHEPYAASKACSEILTQAWADSYLSGRGVGVATVRAGNIIGGGDWSSDRLIPDAIRAFAAEKTLIIRNPAATRPWQHVVEAVRGLLLLAEMLARNSSEHSGAWNIGPSADDALPVADVVARIADMWGPTAKWRHVPDNSVPESNLLTLDASKARAGLGWRPVWRVDRGLRETVNWYRARQTQSDIRALTLAQINAHLGEAA